MMVKLLRFLVVAGILWSITACTGSQPPAEKAAPTVAEVAPAPSGAEVVKKMEAAIKAAKSANFVVDFQIAAIEGPVKGSIEFSGERPSKAYAKMTSEVATLNGQVAVMDGDKGWAYNPSQKIVIVGNKSQYKTQLSDQPELREIAKFAEQIKDRGFENTKADVLGTEQVNGKDVYKVQVTYDKSGEVDLSGVTVTYFVDPKSYLPQRLEINLKRDGLEMSGFMVIKGELGIDAAVDAAKFTFTPPADAQVVDFSKLPKLPDLSSKVPKSQ